MISFQNVSFTYAEGGNGGVLDLNLVVRPGECVLLCGPSGCGKTTVTRLANGLIPHFFHGNLSGQVNVNGMDTRETEIAALSDAVGTVFQNPRTQFFNTDTDSEIVFGLENRGIPREALRSRLDELTEELHLSELRGRNIFELSGGEKQKIAFSSVYASAPDVLVFDEPSSNLDMKAIGELADLIQRAKISGKTILIAEHRIWYLMDIVDRVVYMQDGRIASDMEASAFKALPEADIRRMGLRVRDLSVSESGGVKTIAADGLLSAQKISVRLGGRNVLNDISFQACRGEIIAIAGVNGAGKSTLARMLCGLQKNGSGTVLWAGKPMSRRLRRKKAYMVMQDVGHQLFTDSVSAECALGIKAPNKDEIDRTLEKVELLAYKERHPLSLSGGQMQRLAVVVSDICGKELLVFDEPTSGLDLKSMEEVGALTRSLATQGKVLLIITHDTLLHLMNHTAGFEEELLDLRYYSASEEIPFKEVLSAHQPKQVYPPGTVSAYSNYGAALAALIVEEASGQSYKDYIKEHILLPLGMTHTSVGPFWMDVDGLLDHKAKGYSYTGKGFRREDEMHLRMYPAGAMNGTAADLLLFAEWLAKEPGEEIRLFKSPETKERLFKETWCSYGANAGLSHGFWQYANHPGILGHEGGTYGFKTQFWVEPEAERAILILTNVMETDYCSAIMEAVIEQDARPPKQEVGSHDFSMLFGDYLPARSAWSYVGKIQARMQIIQISKEGEENLRLKMPLADKDLLYEPVGEYQFYCAEAIPEERSLAFSVLDGRVTSMTFRLAHDYVPAGPLNGFAGSFLSLGSYILLMVLWLAILIILGSKIVCKRSSFQWQRIILPICGLILGATGIAGMLHWFSLYTIISTELNIVAGIGIAAAICGIFTELSYVVKRKNRASVLTIVLFALQIIAAWMLGFLTVV